MVLEIHLADAQIVGRAADRGCPNNLNQSSQETDIEWLYPHGHESTGMKVPVLRNNAP